MKKTDLQDDRNFGTNKSSVKKESKSKGIDLTLIIVALLVIIGVIVVLL